MKYYIVWYLHTDMTDWQAELLPHLRWIKEQVATGSLLISGPCFDPNAGEQTNQKEATLIFTAPDVDSLKDLIETDPYWTKGLVADYKISEYQPLFGLLGANAEQIEQHLNSKGATL